MKMTVAGVPDFWVIERKRDKYCYWPKKSDRNKVSGYVKRREQPGKDWLLFRCRVKYEVDTYEEMCSKVREAQNVTTEINSSDTDSTKKINVSIMNAISDSDESINNYSPLPSPPSKRVRQVSPIGKYCLVFRAYLL